jgi:DNA mismatch repair protein MutS2
MRKFFITKQTIKDLEFGSVLEQVAEYAATPMGVQKVMELMPISDKNQLLDILGQTDEYFSSFSNQNQLPNHHFYTIEKSLQLFTIENTFVEGKKMLDIQSIVETIVEMTKFLKKFKTIYPLLFKSSQAIEIFPEIAEMIKAKIDKYGEVLDDATPELKQIRAEKRIIEGQLANSFDKALQRFYKQELLDEIKESVVDGRRVLAVQAKHRKKVTGAVLATSKTGSIIFILPQATQQLDQELQLLRIKEQDEVVKILKALTDALRPFRDELISYESYLTGLDVLKAKANYALSINALLPKISEKRSLSLVKAYHPLLWEQHEKKGIKIIPQTLHLDEKQQIIVISGPNAGGKSLTLKTIGLLQIMLQSGLLVPVDEKSVFSFFDTILTDIGDNQSIENQLSTYSYRLKNMRQFLKKCNANTLFLIDEFGTGSDPELGGALAEVFLETFYQKGAFGVITTHYTNIKALADQLEYAVNANMQFDNRSLEPLYELITGEAGSSFTFEVAQQNGIPFNLINRAKKKVSSSKVRLDKTISKLQVERSKLRRHTETLEQEKDKAQEHAQDLKEKQDKLQDKLEQFQQLYDYQQKMIQLGRVFNEWLNKYFQSNNKKQLLSDFQKFVQAEKVKYTKKNPPKKQTKVEKQKQKKQLQKEENKLKHTEKEVLKKVKVIREKVQKEHQAKEQAIANYEYKVGDVVRFIDGWAQGTVEKVEKNKLLINYGSFTALAEKKQLELVKAK